MKVAPVRRSDRSTTPETPAETRDYGSIKAIAVAAASAKTPFARQDAAGRRIGGLPS
jgi:hypothetical protein